MPKKFYVGVDGLARKGKKIYIGVDGIARKVRRAYIGVGGVARIWWAGGELVYYGTTEELSTGRCQLAATTVGNYALFGGGSSSYLGSEYSKVDAYDTELTHTIPTALRSARDELAATTVGDYAIFGGGGTTVVDAYDTELTRTVPPALSTGRYQLAATTVGDYALFGGGGTTVDAYDTELTRTIPPALSTGRYQLAATTVGNYALFGGGVNSSSGATSGISTVVDAYDTELTHTIPTALSSGRYNLAATTVGRYALFAGGHYNATKKSAVEAYDAELTRTAPTALRKARDKMGATTVGDYALFGGGEIYTSGTVIDEVDNVDAYDSSLTRTTPTALSKARSSLAATTVGDYALFGGGEANAGLARNNVDVYTIK